MSPNRRQAKIAKFNRFQEVDIPLLSSVTTYRPSSAGTSCSKYNIKVKTVPASIIEDMLTEAEAIVKSDAILKGFEDSKGLLTIIKNPNHINDSFEVFCDVETGSVIYKNKNCYKFPTLKICQHCLAILIKTAVLETFVTNYNKTKNISLGQLVEFDKEKNAGKKKRKATEKRKRPPNKKYVPTEKVVFPVKRMEPAVRSPAIDPLLNSYVR